jgi:Predicted metal-dependent hydrolase with the TIM-barrel fold
MSFVRTVLGDIGPEELGVTYAHEHLIIDPSFTTHDTPGFELSDVEKGVEELRRFRAAGGRALVDSMPCDCGRNVLKLAALARGADVHVLAPTGLHLAKYYDPGHWGNRYTETELTELFVTDIEHGIDERDYNGPLVRRTEHRAGLIKIASGEKFTVREEKLFAAAAQAHRRTGAPILTHTEQGLLGLEQVERLLSLGVELGHVVLSHLDRRPDLAYHREILSTGVCVEYDSAFRWKPGRGNPTRDLVVALLAEFPDQVMLGMDAARAAYWTSHGGGPGMDYLLKVFAPELREAGVTEELLRRVFVTTPAKAYAFVRAKLPTRAT